MKELAVPRVSPQKPQTFFAQLWAKETALMTRQASVLQSFAKDLNGQVT